ncbi:MAG TPA: sensor histidine kinase [Verrucomicrobiae bacterium]|jgi:two-component sensor histidine kinase
MPTKTIFQNRFARWLIGFLFWTGIGLSFASQFYISSAKAGLDVTWAEAVNYSLADWYVFALLSIPVIYLARRFPFEERRWRTSLPVHLASSAAFSLTYMVLRAWLGHWQGATNFADAFKPLLVKTWHFNLLVYWVIVAVSQASEYYRKFRQHEMSALELEKRLAQAKLQALQMQLNPHFLFNCLHSISSLMHQDVEGADRMITQLGDLLRAALANSDTQEVPLRQELDFLRRYLEIEQTRFGERLAVKMDIAPETLDALVPNLILQPLVENAIRHGIEPHGKAGRIELRANRQNGLLALEVQDSGAGLRGAPTREGVGLSNTRARLRELYGAAHQFDLRDGADGGLQVRLSIPFRSDTVSHENSSVDRR